jgi:hypothetical protein
MECFSGHVKCHMLQNAMHSVDERRSVRNQADQHKAQTGISLTYKQYVSLLLSAAVSYHASYRMVMVAPTWMQLMTLIVLLMLLMLISMLVDLV